MLGFLEVAYIVLRRKIFRMIIWLQKSTPSVQWTPWACGGERNVRLEGCGQVSWRPLKTLNSHMPLLRKWPKAAIFLRCGTAH